MKRNILLLSLFASAFVYAGETKGPSASKIKITRELFLQKIQQLSDEQFRQIVGDVSCRDNCAYLVKSIVYAAEAAAKAAQLKVSEGGMKMAETLVTYFFDTVRGKDARELAVELEGLSPDSAKLFQEFNESLVERDARQRAILAEQAKKEVEARHREEVAQAQAAAAQAKKLSDEFQKRLAMSQQAMDRWIEKHDQVVAELQALQEVAVAHQPTVVQSATSQPVVVPAENPMPAVMPAVLSEVVAQTPKEKIVLPLSKEAESLPEAPSDFIHNIGLKIGVGCAVGAAVSTAIYFLVKMLKQVQLVPVVAFARHNVLDDHDQEKNSDEQNELKNDHAE